MVQLAHLQTHVEIPIRLRGDESHSSIGGPAHLNHEEEEETPMATSIKTLSCIRLGKHKGKLKQNVIVSH